MRYFHNDYNRMCHPAVLEKLSACQEQAMPGYGMDPCCQEAADTVRTLCGRQDLAVHFLVGGTQANLTVIAAALRPHQGVICAETGHINVHETGAVEATGHKVIGLPSANGKITAQQVEAYVTNHLSDPDAEHTVQPKLVYISDSTELGTVYSLAELQQLHSVCRKYDLYLFVDGARLGYALTAKDSDVTLPQLASLADVFYIGMTKQGALFGECVVISNPELNRDFRYLIKQHGGMLAKGWLLGLQLQALMQDDLYFRMARQANAYADRMRKTLSALGYSYLVETTTNQLFPILPDSVLSALSEEVTFVKMDQIDDTHHAVRFCTSWATTDADVEFLCNLLIKVSN